MEENQMRLREMREKLRLIENNRLEKLHHKLNSIKRGRFTLLNIFGIEKRELSHSNFLKWLLDPNETHELGDEFLSRFVNLIVTRCKKEVIANSIRYGELRVERERMGDESRLDILIRDQSKTFLCVLENKIGSGEGEDQTERLYNDNHDRSITNEFFVYLTLPGEKGPEDDKMAKIWIHITYKDIQKILGSLIKIELNPYTNYLLRDYLKNLDELISLSEFKEFGEKVNLYFEYYQDISDLEKELNKKLNLFLESLQQKLESEKQKWPEPHSWEIESKGHELWAYKKSWYPKEDAGVSFGLYIDLSERGFKFDIYVEPAIRTHFNSKFIKLWKARFGEQKKSIGKGNFQLLKGEAYILGCLIKIDFSMGAKFVDHVAETFTEAVELFSGLIDKAMAVT